MKNPSHPAAAGSQAPELEGAPRSQVHAPRIISVISAPPVPPPAAAPGKEVRP